MSLPEQFEVHDRRVAADGAAYTYSDFEQWYGAHAKQMWEGTAATEHRRVAADGAAYTYADFEQWYSAHARQMWEGAAATEHRHSRTSQSSAWSGIQRWHTQMQRIAADGLAYTYIDFVTWYGTHAELLWESATATEHSGRIDIQALPPRSQASHPTGVTVRESALPRDVTEHSPLDNITTDPATPASALAPTPALTPALDRPDWCERCGNKGVCDSCKRSHEQAQCPLASTEQWDTPPTATLVSRNIPGPLTGPPPGALVRAPAPGVTVRAGAMPRAATEHSPPDNITTEPQESSPSTASPPVLTVADIAMKRNDEKRQRPKRSLHRLARAALNAITEAGPSSSISKNLDDLFPWMAYIACHESAADIIGPGVTHATAEFLEGIRDPNQHGQPRLDFIIYRIDGTLCRVHPGTKKANDAKPLLSSSNHGAEALWMTLE